MTTKLTYGSLFSGVGGFDLGFDQESYECVFQVEWDKHCQNILAKHWPTVPKWSDVQDVNGAEIPPCDVLTFGSPCQDLSVAGKRAGLEGTKSSMFYEATRIIKEMRNATKSVYPRIVVWENVPGALSSNNGADFGAVIDTLADIGAVDIQWSVLDAQYFGVPQRRRRIFVVAQFDPATAARCPDPLLPVIKGSRGDFAKGRKAQQNAARSAEGSIDSGGQWWNGDDTASDPVNMPLSEFGPTLTTTFGAKNYSNHQEVMSGSVMPVAYQFSQSNEIIGALCARDYKGVGNQYVNEGKLVVQDEVVPLKTSNTKANGMNVGELGDPMYTLDTGGSMAVAYSIREDAKNDNFSATETDVALCLNGLQPSTQSHHAQLFIAEPVEQHLAVRRLTPLECERLMGWPDDHTRWTADGTEQADTHRYRQCGNGVATPVAKWIAKHLKNILLTNDEGDE